MTRAILLGSLIYVRGLSLGCRAGAQSVGEGAGATSRKIKDNLRHLRARAGDRDAFSGGNVAVFITEAA